MPASHQYERRLVLFVDFLGFKEHVQRTVIDPAYLNKLVSAMEVIGRIASDSQFRSQQVTQFSDSVVVSYRTEERSASFNMLNDIALVVLQLAEMGFLVRGAVTIGDLLHNGRHVVGPAMVRAHEMESQEAVYPRVIIDPAILDLARSHRSRIHSPDEEEGYIRDFMTQDTDGHFYFDYVSWNSVVRITGGDDELYQPYLANISRMVRRGLEHKDPGVVSKYLWLHDKMTRSLSEFDALPEDHAYWLQTPGLREAMKSIPRLSDVAEQASRRVDGSRTGRPACRARGTQRA